MQRNPHSYQIATGYRTFYSLSLIYQPITKKTIVFLKKSTIKDLYLQGMTAYDASAEIKNTPALMWIFILNVWKFIYIHIRMNIIYV